MSPHALSPKASQDKLSSRLEDFAVSKNAFLPGKSPSECLQDVYYEPWERIVINLPGLIQSDNLRRAVAQIPTLSTEYLRSEAEWRRAYVMLAYMAHAHIWAGETPDEILPPQIAVPFLEVAAHHEIPPALTYAAANLWNFASNSSDFTDVEQLRSLVTFTGSESESWFLLISVAMEAQAAGMIETLSEALEAIKRRDYDTIVFALNELRHCINNVGELLERMYERCEPQYFYDEIRPFLAGSKNMEAAGLPRGVFYEDGHGGGEWLQLRGGSNGQSSLIQFFDIVLGVEHKSNGNNTPAPGERSFQEEVKDYMPGPHRRFLLHVSRMGSIRELATQPAATESQAALQTAYKAATDALTDLRNKHIKIVTRYIILPSKKHCKKSADKKNLATSGAEGKVELTGTGGTSLVPFLKQFRDETTQAGRLPKPSAADDRLPRLVEALPQREQTATMERMRATARRGSLACVDDN